MAGLLLVLVALAVGLGAVAFFLFAGKRGGAGEDGPSYAWTIPENPHESYRSEALNISPMPGVRVEAPEGALDRPRKIDFGRLPRRRAEAASERLDRRGYLMEAALHFDAGMGSSDRFRRPVKVVFDLAELGVEERLWRYAGLMTEAEDGSLVLQATSVDGSRLEWSTTHNGVVFVVVGLSTIIGLTKFGLIDPDREAETEGKEWFGFLSDSGRFNVLWPVDSHRNVGEAADAFGRLERIWEEYRTARRTGRLPPPPAPGVPSPWRDFDSYFLHLHQVIEGLEATVGDREWKKRHWAHPAAAVVAEALDFARAYLVGRGFNAPGPVINVYLRDPWPHPNSLLGLAENRLTRKPFISVQLQGVPAQSRTDKLEGEQGVSMEVTLIHELFHVFQTQYGPGEYLNRNSFWIGEATALTLERELLPHYGDRFKNQAWYRRALTARNPYWYAYRSPMEPSGITGFGAFVFTDNDSLQHHGYGYSYFFEYLRDEIGGTSKEGFLSSFYDALNRTGSAAGALQRLSRDGSGKDLAEHYEAFVRAHAIDIALQPSPEGRENVAVTSEERHFGWPWQDVMPLSSQIYGVLITNSVPGYDDSVIVLETESRPETIKMRYRGLASRSWQEVSDPLTLVPKMIAPSRGEVQREGFQLQAIGAYSPKDAAPGPGMWWITYLLPPSTPPELPQGPRLDLASIDEGREKELQVRWRKSPLAGDAAYRRAFSIAMRGQNPIDASRSHAHAQKAGHEAFSYEIELETWAGGRRIIDETVLAYRERTETSIPWQKVMPPRPEDRLRPFEVRVRMREVLVFGERRIRGEPGEFSTLIIEPVICEDTVFSVSIRPGSSGGRAKDFSFYLMPENEVVAAAQARKGSRLTDREREDVLTSTFRSSMRDAGDQRAIQQSMPAECFELLGARQLFIMWHGVYTQYKPDGEIELQAEYERGYRVRTIVQDEAPAEMPYGSNPFGGFAPRIRND